MAYKTRESLANKMEAAYSAAAAKEGREITRQRISIDMINPKVIAYRCRSGCLLFDGRYITRFWDAENDTHPWMEVDNLPVATLRCLVNGDHEEDTQQEQKECHEDFEYQNYLKTETLTNPVDRYAYQSNFGNPENIVIRRLCGTGKHRLPTIDLSTLGTDPHIGFTTSGHFDEKTKRQIKAIVRAFIMGLPEKKRDDCLWLFSTDLMQKEIAEMTGVSDEAISKRKKGYVKKLAELFRSHGYPVITKDEEKEEAEQRRSYADHYEAASKALKELYCPEEEDEESEENEESA